MRYIKLSLFILLCFLLSNCAVAQKRFKDEVFTAIDSTSNIQYGQAINLNGVNQALLLDVFLPHGADTLAHRPLVIFIHGGGFQSNTKNGAFSSRLCATFAKRGYVAASIDYRLGIEGTKSNKDYAESMYRAQQDGKAAVRFFRRYAEKYGVDTSQIFVAGSSAGSKTCLAMAYMKQADVPKEISTDRWGTLEGNSGNNGYSSKVQGVINCWGALIDYKWIKKGDAPLFNTAGTADKTVPSDSAFDYHGFKYGPHILYRYCLSLGVPTAWRPFVGAGHTLDNIKIKQDSCIASMAAWLYSQLKSSKGKNEEGVYRYEKDIQAFDSLNVVEKHSNKAIMFLGSSYIRFWKNIREDIHYGDVIHRGFGGSNMRDVAYYIKRIVYPHHPKALFMYVGNDIVDGPRDKTPDQVLELFKYVVSIVREKYPDMPITWLQISPSEKRWGVWAQVIEANKLIEQYCKTQHNLFYITSADKFLGADGKPLVKYYRDDKLHYNDEGYKVWGANIAARVAEITQKEN